MKHAVTSCYGCIRHQPDDTLLGGVTSDALSPTNIATLTAGTALVLLLPGVAWQWSAFERSSVGVRGWLAVLWWGAGTLGLGAVLWYTGVKQVRGSTAAGFMG